VEERFMYAVEFNVEVNDGIIKIPKEYGIKNGHNVRVIILANDDESKKSSRKFNAVRIKTSGFKFDREAANDR